jgi:transcriptional antiterminator NusG
MDEPDKIAESPEQPPADDGGTDTVNSVESDGVASAEPVAAEEEEVSSTVEEVGESGETESGETEVKQPARRGPIEEAVDEDEDITMDWYILKVQSNRENTICDALRRRVAVAGLDKYFGDVMVPTEDVAEFKNGKKKIVKRKLFPGYIVAHMCINDDTWFLVRETPGIGDFTGSQGKPSPMLKHEVDRIVKSANPDEEDGEQVKTAIPFKLGDRVRIKEGTFENFEGDVDGIDEANGRVTVMISIFNRSTPFEAEHWQIEAI